MATLLCDCFREIGCYTTTLNNDFRIVERRTFWERLHLWWFKRIKVIEEDDISSEQLLEAFICSDNFSISSSSNIYSSTIQSADFKIYDAGTIVNFLAAFKDAEEWGFELELVNKALSNLISQLDSNSEFDFYVCTTDWFEKHIAYYKFRGLLRSVEQCFLIIAINKMKKELVMIHFFYD